MRTKNVCPTVNDTGILLSLPWMLGLGDLTMFELSTKHPSKISRRFTGKNIFPPLSNAFEPPQWTTNLNGSSNWNRLRKQSSFSGPFFPFSTFPLHSRRHFSCQKTLWGWVVPQFWGAGLLQWQKGWSDNKKVQFLFADHWQLRDDVCFFVEGGLEFYSKHVFFQPQKFHTCFNFIILSELKLPTRSEMARVFLIQKWIPVLGPCLVLEVARLTITLLIFHSLWKVYTLEKWYKIERKLR